MANWRDAAEKFRQANPQNVKPKPDMETMKVADDLNAFLASEKGKEAKLLLETSGLEIVFGHGVSQFGDCPGTFVLCDGGLALRMDDGNILGPPADAWEVIMVAANAGLCDDIRLLVEWIGIQLDKIAAAAPEPTKK